MVPPHSYWQAIVILLGGFCDSDAVANRDPTVSKRGLGRIGKGVVVLPEFDSVLSFCGLAVSEVVLCDIGRSDIYYTGSLSSLGAKYLGVRRNAGGCGTEEDLVTNHCAIV